jgi:hypothetical protein
MAVGTKQSNVTASLDTALASPDNGKISAQLMVSSDSFEIAVADIADVNDVIELTRIPSSARVHSIMIFSDELDTNGSPTLATDCGIYLTDGTVKDADAFGSAVTTGWGDAAGAGTEFVAESAGIAATATVTITAYAELNSGDKVNLISTDGTNYNFVNGDQSSVAGTWESTTSNNATATNLMNCINTSSGPSGTRFTATVDGAVVTITQAVLGVAGAANSVVALTDSGTAGMTKTDFTGGSAPAVHNIGKKLWEIVGVATDPHIDYDINLRLTAVAATGAPGTLAFSIQYSLH